MLQQQRTNTFFLFHILLSFYFHKTNLKHCLTKITVYKLSVFLVYLCCVFFFKLLYFLYSQYPKYNTGYYSFTK